MKLYIEANGHDYRLQGDLKANDLGEALKDCEEGGRHEAYGGLAGSILTSATWDGEASHPLASCIMFEKGMSASDCLVHLHGHNVSMVPKRTLGIGRRSTLVVWSHAYQTYYVLRFKYEPASMYANDRKEVPA